MLKNDIKESVKNYNNWVESAIEGDITILIPSALSDKTLGVGNGWESTIWATMVNAEWEVV